jgi:hypothetical protein
MPRGTPRSEKLDTFPWDIVIEIGHGLLAPSVPFQAPSHKFGSFARLACVDMRIAGKNAASMKRRLTMKVFLHSQLRRPPLREMGASPALMIEKSKRTRSYSLSHELFISYLVSVRISK